jgi:hypothetical protein
MPMLYIANIAVRHYDAQSISIPFSAQADRGLNKFARV